MMSSYIEEHIHEMLDAESNPSQSATLPSGRILDLSPRKEAR